MSTPVWIHDDAMYRFANAIRGLYLNVEEPPTRNLIRTLADAAYELGKDGCKYDALLEQIVNASDVACVETTSGL